ncbi:SDR family NAD(P)-dependent oxidoreductase [Streptomyces sp. NPDC093568]|uniref:SDR family NAD(P)-dependent oxidoreductase n=1 Tax=Streptomyces sp. NPDC093568 TaxID=3366041 RepID=UPI00381FB37C
MNINGPRVLVAGATGVLGSALTAELAARGARPALAGRDAARPARAARAHPGSPTADLDAYDPSSCARAVHAVTAEFRGLDAVVTAFGAVGFGTRPEVDDAVAEYLTAGNFLAPAAFFRAATQVLPPHSVIAAFTGVVAEQPQPRMADYSASKAALSAWLAAARRETRGVGVQVLDVRPGHLDTGLADRSVAGTAPPLPPGGDSGQVVKAVVDAMESDAEAVRTTPGGAAVVERRAR